jgi:hypothetical protein
VGHAGHDSSATAKTKAATLTSHIFIAVNDEFLVDQDEFLVQLLVEDGFLQGIPSIHPFQPSFRRNREHIRRWANEFLRFKSRN